MSPPITTRPGHTPRLFLLKCSLVNWHRPKLWSNCVTLVVSGCGCVMVSEWRIWWKNSTTVFVDFIQIASSSSSDKHWISSSNLFVKILYLYLLNLSEKQIIIFKWWLSCTRPTCSTFCWHSNGFRSGFWIQYWTCWSGTRPVSAGDVKGKKEATKIVPKISR